MNNDVLRMNDPNTVAEAFRKLSGWIKCLWRWEPFQGIYSRKLQEELDDENDDNYDDDNHGIFNADDYGCFAFIQDTVVWNLNTCSLRKPFQPWLGHYVRFISWAGATRSMFTL